jgi:bifunctional non-homologous end joining protein LigD
MLPMLATRGDSVPLGDDWLHDIKWDGYRTLVEIHQGRVRVSSRTERDVSIAFPELAALGSLPNGVLDGELVVFRDGKPLIHGIAERFQVQSGARAVKLAESLPATLVVFDVVDCLGEPMLGRPLIERRQFLDLLPLADTGVAQLSPVFDDGEALMQAARAQDLEGIVSKRKQSIYRPGVRSPDWLKFPMRSRASLVIGGYRLERGGARIGSLLVGEPSEGGLMYRGRVALAVPAQVERAMADRLTVSHVAASPFAEVPEDDARDAVWVEPVTVIDVEFLSRTPDGRLRHPTYMSVRADLNPEDIVSG